MNLQAPEPSIVPISVSSGKHLRAILTPANLYLYSKNRIAGVYFKEHFYA